VTRLARALLLLITVPALAATASPAAAAAPAPAAPASVHLEAEAARSPGAAAVADPTASGHRARLVTAGRSLTVRLSAPAAGSRLVVRVRAAAATGQAPVVTVDGRRAAGRRVTGRGWRDLVVGSGQEAGAHTVTIRNPVGRRRPALLVDRVSFVPSLARVVAAPTVPAPAPVDDAYETRIVQLVNAHRAAAGLAPLRVSACADRYAEDWSATMARTGSFQHRPSLGSVMTACRAVAVGENIASGYVTADRMVAMWMASAGHRANILSSRFTHLGVGAARTASGRTYGTQNFLRLG